MNDPRLIAFIVILTAIIGLLALFPPFKEMSNTAAVRRHNPWKGHPIRAPRLIWSASVRGPACPVCAEWGIRP